MNLERSASNEILVTARQVAGETHYLLKFQRVEAVTDIRYCVTTNSALSSGPLLLEVTETEDPTAVDGEVELMAGDWNLTVYGQNSGTNMDPTGRREIWSELITIS